MRTSEWIQIGFAVALAAAAWICGLPEQRRWVVTLLGAIAVCAIALVRGLGYFVAPQYVSVIRDWLTAVLMLVPYWQAGQFFLGPNERIQEWLASFDRRWMPKVAAASGTPKTGFGFFLEIAYMFCYPLVPAGLAVLYIAGRRDAVGFFWFVVLVATYFCYTVTPFFPALPPRSVGITRTATADPNVGRVFNRWLLQHGSIHAISFPSAHAASALAVALVLLWVVPVAGAIFLFVAVCIGVAAVVGRYHYALDVLLGAATAIVVFAATYAYLKR